MIVNCRVNNSCIPAVVDTAADVTIISEKVYKTFCNTPVIGEETNLITAGNFDLKARKVGPVQIKLGQCLLSSYVYVAAISDHMLLGIDILHQLEAKIDLESKNLVCQGHTIPLQQELKQKLNTPIPVILKHRVKIPGNCEVLIPIYTSEYLHETFLFSSSQELPISIINAVYQNTHHIKVCFINTNIKAVVLNPGTVIGFLNSIQEDEILPLVKQISCSKKHVDPKNINNFSSLPEKCVDLLNRAGNGLLDQETMTKLKNILISNESAFSDNDYDLGTFTEVSHHIETGDARPIKLGLRRTPIHFIDEEDQLLKKMLDVGVIEPSSSSWAAAPVLIRKKDGKVRWCIDYRCLNNVSKKDTYPLPLMDECIDTLEGNIWFSKLDANSAYWQIPIADDGSKEKTAFRTRQGLFHFNKLPFGLCNAPSTYSRAMNLVLHGMQWTKVLAFLDDICVLGSSTDDHLNNLNEVLSRFQQYGLKLKAEKCELFKEEIQFLGRKVSRAGVSLTDQSIKTIAGWIEPKNVKELQRFLGFANYHRGFIENFSEIAEPLNRLLRKKVSFKWGTDQQMSFELLKAKLSSPPVLSIPTKEGMFILDTDASDHSIGAELLQVQNGVERVIAYGSFSLQPCQRRYCTTRKELLAIVRFTHHFKHYLLGREFIVRTDHSSLIWLTNFKQPQGQLARWIEELSRFSMKIEHRPGKYHSNADALSRLHDYNTCPNTLTDTDLNDLPCKGCKYCTKAHYKWKKFEEEIDDTLDLSQSNQTKSRSGINVILEKSHMVRDIKIPDDKSPWDEQSIKLSQSKDNDLQFLLNWLTNQHSPSEEEFLLADKRQKFYFINKNQFFLSGDIIYKKGLEQDLLVVPKELVNKVFNLCHDNPCAAHPGISRTKNRIQQQFFWYGMGGDTKAYVQGCTTCNQNKSANRKNKFPLQMNHAGIPMEKVHMDFIGPLPKSKLGNEYILVIIDQFTKWVECIPLPNQEAETSARAAINDFFCRFGCPLILVTDQGRNFESNLFKEVCKLLQIHKSRTTAYRPSANGQVERVNRTLMASIRCYINKNPDNWDEKLSLITSALRSSVNRNTGFTPNRLMLGREINIPADILLPQPDGQVMGTYEYVKKLQESLHSAHEIARTTLKGQLKRAKLDYDIRAKTTTFKVGDTVYYLDNARKDKLHPIWIGPCLIITVISPCVFKIMINNRSEKIVNHDMLKMCGDRKLPPWILKQKQNLLNNLQLLYCTCRKPDDGSFMIECENCQEWFHAHCLGLTINKARRLDNFLCTECKK